ncbi:MAG: hypothetical protein B6U76_10730 [Desulfurococcales archaeon ex4484_217_2]|nr:MAG: hypothetical protein B6U76_10730 [Desulfurococcales archaeon ex4484_217_2]
MSKNGSEVKVEVVIRNIQKPKFREKILGIVLGKHSIFKLTLVCKEDIPGGRIFELYLVVDRFDELRNGKYFEAEGDVGYASVEGSSELFNAIRRFIGDIKYYVSPWNTIPALISYVECRSLTKDEFLRRISLKDNRFSRGWFNFFSKYGVVDFENLMEKIRINLRVKVI